MSFLSYYKPMTRVRVLMRTFRPTPLQSNPWGYTGVFWGFSVVSPSPLRKIHKQGGGLVEEVVGAVDNKAGHYSVSPARQGWADGQRGGYTCSGAEGAPTPAPESIRHQCRPRHQKRADPRQRMPGYSRLQAPSLFTVAGRGSGWADL